MLMADQGTRKARRLYVGNLPAGHISEQMLVDFFEAAVYQAGIVMAGLPGKPVVSAWVSTDDDRRFAFVEFRTMEECANALSLNGIVFQGESLRISRPSDFDDAVRAMQAQGITIPPGPGLPMMPAAAAPAAGIGTMQLAAAITPGTLAMGALMAQAVAPAPAATSAMKLENMVKTEDLQDPDDIEDIKGDVREECEKNGVVKSVYIPGPGQSGCGNVYVLFGDTAAAVKAQGNMHGRLFDGAKIIATFYDVAKMESATFD